ncbi:MAG: hemolysin [Actinomycetia bacterium]|nr:hemolysin [Actinomycetes bacterium]
MGIVTSSSTVAQPHPAPAAATLTRPRMRGWLHFYAFCAAIVCGIVLCSVAATRPGLGALLGCAVYSVTVCGLFGISALYHRKLWGPRGFAVMRRLDHSMIFVFIAGTYTPFSLILLPPGRSTVLLGAVWSGALAGVALKVAFPGSPRWLGVPLYIALGWAAVFVLPDIMHTGGVTTLVLLAAGGVIYSVGAVFYASKWPNPWPHTFGHHEFFHACTLIAAILHYIAVYFALFA